MIQVRQRVAVRSLFLKTLAMIGAMALPGLRAQAAFEDPFWSARVAALGGAVTAVSPDATSAFYNPAATVFMSQRAMQFTYAKLFAGLEGVDLSLGQAAFVQPLRSFNALTVGYGSVNASSVRREDVAVIGFAHLIRDVAGFGDVSVAASGRHLSQTFSLDSRTANDPVFSDGNKRSAYALDLHVYLPEVDALSRNLSLGFSARGINRPDIGFKEKDKMPMELALGVAYRWRQWTFPIDLVRRGEDLTPSVGAEGRFSQERLALRAGTDTHQAGAGMGYRHALSPRFGLSFDYSFLWPLDVEDTSGSHRATVGLTF